MLGGAAVLLAALAVGAAVYAFGGSRPAKAVLEDAGCTLNTYQGQGQRHVSALPRGFKYNSFPPTTGPHHEQPAPLDVYDQPVEQLRLVHNLEHGAVVIQYGRGIPRSEVDAMVEWYRGSPNGLLIAPFPALGDRVALAAWNAEFNDEGEIASQHGVLAKCPRFDATAFDAFIGEYGFRGPERATREQLPPGSG